jgi:hypothetical protein
LKSPELAPEGSGYLVIGASCPVCHHPGPYVARQTVFDHLDPEGVALIHFWDRISVCLDPDCDCLYYSAGRWVPYRYCNKKLGYKKNSPPPHILCYCLGFTAEEVLRDHRDPGPGSCLEMIERHVQQGALLCSKMNPTGLCCWGQIQQYLRQGA